MSTCQKTCCYTKHFVGPESPVVTHIYFFLGTFPQRNPFLHDLITREFPQSLQCCTVVLGSFDAFVYAPHQHRRIVENPGNFGDSMKGRVWVMTAITLAFAHAYQATCLAQYLSGVPHHNFRLPSYPYLPNDRSITRERGDDHRGWAFYTDGGTRIVDGETLAGWGVNSRSSWKNWCHVWSRRRLRGSSFFSLVPELSQLSWDFGTTTTSSTGDCVSYNPLWRSCRTLGLLPEKSAPHHSISLAARYRVAACSTTLSRGLENISTARETIALIFALSRVENVASMASGTANAFDIVCRLDHDDTLDRSPTLFPV